MIAEYFIQLVIILVAARLFGEFASRFKIPSVIGELFAGILLGPSLLNFIQPSDTLELIAQIGIVLLLFEVGLETDISRLIKAGLRAATAAFAGVITPLIFGFLLSYYYFNLSALISLFIGCTLTATSIGITMRVMADLKRQNSKEAHIVLGAAILDDIIGIVLLALLFEFAETGAVELANAGEILLFIVIFLFTAPFAALLISNIIKNYDRKSTIPGLLPSTIVALLLFFAWLAHSVGAPELLGGFAAGVALSQRSFLIFPDFFRTEGDFLHKVEGQMKPIIHLFTPIFFVNVGLMLNFREIDWNSSFLWLGSALFLTAAIIGKLASGFILFKESRFVRLAVGLAMIPRGEVGIIFSDIGKKTGAFSDEIFACMIVVISLTTICAPLAMRSLYSSSTKVT